MKKLVGIVCVMAIVITSVFASGELTGKDFVRLGALGTITGTLEEENGEWMLLSGEVKYEIHFGNYEVLYPDGLKLVEGETATVVGFIYQQDISVCTITSEQNSYTFRDETGRPAWAGKGNSNNAKTVDHDHDIDDNCDSDSDKV